MMLKKVLKKINVRIHPGHLYSGPEWIVLGVNNICNLHCKMCDVGNGFTESNFSYNLIGAKPLNMPLELIKKIIDQTALYYPNAKLGYAFTEPIIYPHLIESVQYAHSKNLYKTITTNAFSLPKSAKELAAAGLDEIFVSLDGPPEIHNEIRQKNKSFEKAIEGIESIVSASNGKTKASVFCCITEWNIGKLVEFVKLFEKIPIKKLGFMHTNFTTSEIAEKHNKNWGDRYPATASNMTDIDLKKMDLDLLYHEITEIKKLKTDFEIGFSADLKTREEIDTFYLRPEIKVGKICNDAFRAIMIKSNGEVIPSHGRCYVVNAGNIYNNTLPEIWNSNNLSTFRKDLIKEGGLLTACSRCCSAF
jgi:Fe-coproporphyrin III synthase